MTAGCKKDAVNAARALLVRSLPGSRSGSVRGHLTRAEIVAAAIWCRWAIGPWAWQAKHLRWYLEVFRGAASTRYDHWRTVRVLAVALRKFELWEPYLRGAWLRPTGEAGAPLGCGRPPKLPGCGVIIKVNPNE